MSASSHAPAVSIIVPICNVETYLEQCLESIAAQTLVDFEAILLNDGSTDGSFAIMRQFAERDSRFIAIDKANEGYGATCNRGLDMARGTWVCIIEPDDWIEPTMLAEMTSFGESFGMPVDIVKCPWIDVLEWDSPATQHEKPSYLQGRIKTSSRPFLLKDETVLIETHPSIWSALYRREFLNQHGIRFIPYPGAGWADNPFLIETLAQARAIVYLDKAFYHYRADLPYSTLNHATDEAVARPFDRWIDMMAVLDRLGVQDKSILASHYHRGFRYLDGAINDDGWEHPVVREKARQMFDLMDKDIVLSNPKLRNRQVKLYFSVTGQGRAPMIRPNQLAYLVTESFNAAKREGPAKTVQRVLKFIDGSTVKHAEKPED